MYTYTFPYEHFGSIMSHITGIEITVESLTLNNFTYTMVCNQQIDSDQYTHMRQYFNLLEIV